MHHEMLMEWLFLFCMWGLPIIVLGFCAEWSVLVPGHLSGWCKSPPPPQPGSSVCVTMVLGKEKKDGGGGGGRTKCPQGVGNGELSPLCPLSLSQPALQVLCPAVSWPFRVCWVSCHGQWLSGRVCISATTCCFLLSDLELHGNSLSLSFNICEMGSCLSC